MFFVTGGKLSYNRGTCEQMKVTSKHWISEPSLWTTWAHLGSLVARVECHFIAIDAQRFVNITSNFSTHHASTYAEKFVQVLNAGNLSDIGEDDEYTRKLVLDIFQDESQNIDLPANYLFGRLESVKNSSRSATLTKLSSH